MNPEGPGQYLGPLDPQVDSTVLDRGDRRLRNPGQLGKLVLTQLLKLTNDANRFPRGYIHGLPGAPKLTLPHPCYGDSGPSFAWPPLLASRSAVP